MLGSPSDPPAGKPGRVQQTPGDGTPPSLHIKLGDNELRIVHPEAMGLDGDDIRGLIARFGCKPVRKSSTCLTSHAWRSTHTEFDRAPLWACSW